MELADIMSEKNDFDAFLNSECKHLVSTGNRL